MGFMNGQLNNAHDSGHIFSASEKKFLEKKSKLENPAHKPKRENYVLSFHIYAIQSKVKP